MDNFTPLEAMIGGALIGLSAGVLWLANGRIAGISGILGGLLPFKLADAGWRLAFLIALPIGAWVGFHYARQIFSEIPTDLPSIDLAPLALAGAGVLVGIGTRLGGGCTSGHGVCGLARFSARSAVAVATFMSTAMATVFLTRHVL